MIRTLQNFALLKKKKKKKKKNRLRVYTTIYVREAASGKSWSQL